MKTFTLLVITFLFSQLAIGQIDSVGFIEGKVIDKANKQPLMFANVTIYKSGAEIPETGTETDLDGNYSISNLDEGLYDVVVSYVGYTSLKTTKVKITSNKITTLNIELSEGVKSTCCCFRYREPLIRFDYFSSGRVFKADEIEKSPIKN